MKARLIVVGTVLSAIILLVVIQTTTPSTIGPVGLLAVFFLLYVIIMGCMTEMLYAGSGALRWAGSRVKLKRRPARMSLVRAWYFASLYALAPIMLLAMQSIGSLGVYEVFLIAVFVVIGSVYISKRTPK